MKPARRLDEHDITNLITAYREGTIAASHRCRSRSCPAFTALTVSNSGVNVDRRHRPRESGDLISDPPLTVRGPWCPVCRDDRVLLVTHLAAWLCTEISGHDAGMAGPKARSRDVREGWSGCSAATPGWRNSEQC
ncbi:MAG: hypothetical protein ACRDRQ_02110 [Pseudonocardiaceae bacterium]